MSKLKTLKDYIAFFEAIPEEKWGTGRYVSSNGCMCAMGHLGRRNMGDTPEAIKFDRILNGLDIVGVNDGRLSFMTLGESPKVRVLNYLSLIEAGVLKEIA